MSKKHYCCNCRKECLPVIEMGPQTLDTSEFWGARTTFLERDISIYSDCCGQLVFIDKECEIEFDPIYIDSGSLH